MSNRFSLSDDDLVKEIEKARKTLKDKPTALEFLDRFLKQNAEAENEQQIHRNKSLELIDDLAAREGALGR